MKANHVHEVIDIGWIIAVSQHDGWSGTVFYINVGVSILLSVRARFRQTRSKARMNTRRNLLGSGLIVHSQKMTMAAMVIADMKV